MNNDKITREILTFTEKLTKFEQQKSTGTPPPIVLINMNSAAFNLAVVTGEEIGRTYEQINAQCEDIKSQVTSSYDMKSQRHYTYIMKLLFNAPNLEHIIKTALTTSALLTNQLDKNN